MSRISHLQKMSSTKGVERGRSLRENATDAERALWQHLRARQLAGVKFRRQVPLGSFVVDFLSEECRLIVELDGGQHAGNVNYDEARTKWLERQGYRVVRFWNSDVLTNIEGVLLALTLTLSQGRGNIRACSTDAQTPNNVEVPAGIPSPLGEGEGEGIHE